MRKVFLFLFLAMVTMATSSCGKLDQRDEFIGDYSLKIHGELAFEDGTSQTLDRENLVLHIEKAEGNFKMSITGFYTCGATVVGGVIVLDESIIQQNNSAGGINTIIVHKSNGVFIDNTLTFVNEITGTINGKNFDGWFSNEAVKL